MTQGEVTVGSWQSTTGQRSDLQVAIHSGWSRRWSHAGRLADYVAAFFRADLDELTRNRSGDALGFLGYAVNEMVENAVKFGQGEHIELQAMLFEDQLTVTVSSRAQAEAAGRYRQMVEEIADGDPLMLLLERVERNAEEGPSAGSGLGLLSMMTDYGASLAWRFVQEQDEEVAISTMARLPINELGTQ